jgi:hypothetical protein
MEHSVFIDKLDSINDVLSDITNVTARQDDALAKVQEILTLLATLIESDQSILLSDLPSYLSI